MPPPSNLSPASQAVVDRLDSAFPDAWLEKTARETGLVKRMRSFSPVLLFWVLVLQTGVHLRVSLEGIRRRYNVSASEALSHASFYDRFTPELVRFLHACVLRGLEQLAQGPSRRLSERLARFKDILIQDSTIIRVSDLLFKKWPATRSRKEKAAGVKLSCLLSVVSDGPTRVKLQGERVSEVKTLKVGSWVKDKLLLIDLGFFKYGLFDRIEANGGFFVSRLKQNADPTITTLLRRVRGNSIIVEGEKLRDVLPKLKREVLDVEVLVRFAHREYAGKKRMAERKFRVVAIRDEEDDEYHAYVTNLAPEEFSAEDVASLYRARWEVELVFRELKNEYSLDQIPTANPHVVQALVWTAILTLVVQRMRYLTMLQLFPDLHEKVSHEQSAKIFREHAASALFSHIVTTRGFDWDPIIADYQLETSGAFLQRREHDVHIKEWRP